MTPEHIAMISSVLTPARAGHSSRERWPYVREGSRGMGDEGDMAAVGARDWLVTFGLAYWQSVGVPRYPSANTLAAAMLFLFVSRYSGHISL